MGPTGHSFSVMTLADLMARTETLSTLQERKTVRQPIAAWVRGVQGAQNNVLPGPVFAPGLRKVKFATLTKLGALCPWPPASASPSVGPKRAAQLGTLCFY